MEKPLREDCPHCGTKSVAFEVRQIAIKNIREGQHQDIFGVCARCERGVLFMQFQGTGVLSSGIIVAPAPPHELPRHLSKRVEGLYRQGLDNLPQNPDAAGMTFRKTLDVALKEKFPTLEGKLVKRIEQAAAQGKLTRDLADWAHQIRTDGNDAAHDVPFSKEDAQRLRDFTHLVLTYLFALPGMLEKAKVDNEGPEAEEKANGARKPKIPNIRPLRGDAGVL